MGVFTCFLKSQLTIGMFLSILLIFSFQIALAEEPKTDPKSRNEGMVYIEDGYFIMGDEETAATVVLLSPYWIDLKEVTNVQYAEFMAAGAYQNEKIWPEAVWTWLQNLEIKQPYWWDLCIYNSCQKYPNHPIVGISYFEAQEYCESLGKRLPTEAEWEMAAKGPFTQNRKYPWGDNTDSFCDKANMGNCYDNTLPVGSLPKGASYYGLLDMTGNAMEWTADAYIDNPYKKDYYENPQYPGYGFDNSKTVKGGNWMNQIFLGYCYSRRAVNFDERTLPVGFRCVKSDKPKETINNSEVKGGK